MRLGGDLDGVVADMEWELVRQAELLFGHVPVASGPAQNSPPEPEDGLDSVPALQRLRLTPRQQSRLWKHVEGIENFWESLSEHEAGAVARLAAIAEERRWEVIFL